MDTNPTDAHNEESAATPWAKTIETLELFGYCYTDRIALLPKLTAAFTNCGGWILERRTISPTAMEYRFEIQLSGIVEMYGSLVGLGLELTRGTHDQLTDLCVCRKHMTVNRDSCPVLTIRLEIAFLADMTLHSMLMTGSGLA
jgi:hypothetical protein